VEFGNDIFVDFGDDKRSRHIGLPCKNKKIKWEDSSLTLRMTKGTQKEKKRELLFRDKEHFSFTLKSIMLKMLKWHK